MRVAFFGQSGPYAPIALRRLMQRGGSYEMAVVLEGRRSTPGRIDHRLLTPGTRLPAAVDADDLCALGLTLGMPVLQTADVNAPRVVAKLARLQIDWLVCVGFDRLFSRDLLRVAALGRINAHPSALPELRGPSPLFWLLRRGARSSAVTLHAIDRFEDHGEIYDQRPFIFPPLASGADLFRVAGEIAGDMLADALEKAASGQLRGVAQRHEAATRAPRPRAEDALVVPVAWGADALVHFASGAPYFRPAWMRLGDDTFFMRRGCEAQLGRRLPAEYVLRNSDLFVQASDGVAHVEIQV